MLKTQENVRQFLTAVGLDCPKKFQMENLKTLPFARMKAIVMEEAEEFRVGMDLLEKAVQSGEDPTSQLVEVLDAVCDIIVVALNTPILLGVDLEPFFDEVQRSNMTKVGGPKREDGKALKPLTFSPPDLVSLVEKLKK